eukprot:scaffold77000_cov45-Prasinocladus_malaysianus.AAC.1
MCELSEDTGHGGPWYIVRYDDGSEEELDRASLMPRLLGSKPVPLHVAVGFESRLMTLQRMRWEPEPFGEPAKAQAGPRGRKGQAGNKKARQGDKRFAARGRGSQGRRQPKRGGKSHVA